MSAVQVEFAGNVAKLLSGFDKLDARMAKHEERMQKLANESKKPGEEAEKGATAFDKMGMAVGRTVAQYLTAAAALGAVQRAFASVSQASEEALQRLRTNEFDRASLAELAGGDVQKLRAFVAAANDLKKKGMPNADLVTYNLESAGYLEERDLFVGAVNAGMNAEKVSTGMARMAAAFETGDDIGTASQVLSKASMAGVPGSGVDASQIMEAMSGAATPGAQLGLRDEELFAALGVVARTADASEAGTQVSSLFSALVAQGFGDQFKGESLEQMLDRVEAMGMSDQQLQVWLGRKEAQKAFHHLRGEQLPDTLAMIEDAQANETIWSIIESTRAIPELAAAQDVRAAEGALDVAAERRAYREARLEALELEEQAAAERENRLGGGGLVRFRQYATPVTTFLRRMEFDREYDELAEQGDFLKIQRRIAESNDETARNTRPGPAVPGAHAE